MVVGRGVVAETSAGFEDLRHAPANKINKVTRLTIIATKRHTGFAHRIFLGKEDNCVHNVVSIEVWINMIEKRELLGTGMTLHWQRKKVLCKMTLLKNTV